MPRAPRQQVADGLYHVTSRGNRREPIFLDSLGFGRFLAILELATRRFGWRCIAYCLMRNHYHLVIRTPEANISQGMHLLNGSYARWFNLHHGLQGHLFERRFHAAAIESDWHLLESCRYVVLNPVRAGLVVKPADWKWSSYRATIAAHRAATPIAVDEVLGYFGGRRADACEAFRSFVADVPTVVRSRHVQVPGTGTWPD